MRIYDNPNVNCFWLSSKLYILPGIIKFYLKNGNFDKTNIILALQNQISSIIIKQKSVTYFFINGSNLYQELYLKDITEIQNLLKYLGWRYSEIVVE